MAQASLGECRTRSKKISLDMVSVTFLGPRDAYQVTVQVMHIATEDHFFRFVPKRVPFGSNRLDTIAASQ